MVFRNVLGRSTSVAVAALFMLCSAQGSCRQSSQSKNAQAGPAAKNNNSNNNAFPQAQSETAAKAAAQNAASQNQATSSRAKKLPGSQSSTAQQNPFPEAQSEAAAKGGGDSGKAQSRDNPAPSSSSAGYSSSDTGLPDADLGQGTVGSHEKMDSFTRDHTMDGRIEDDLNVADLYMKNGDYRGALLRYQDVIQYDPQNDTALFGIANAMCKQNRTAEAMASLKSYAKNNPQGKYALKAEKLIAHPDKCAHNW